MLDGDEVGMTQDRQIRRDRRGDTLDRHLLQRPDRTRDRGVAVLAPDDDLADQVVVELADLVARFVTAVEANAEAVGGDELGDPARRREEASARRILGVDADLDAVTAAQREHLVLRERQRLARGDADLPLDEVKTADHLGDGVLDLKPGVHLEEEEVTVLVDELDGPGVVVADRLGGLDRGVAHRRLDAVGKSGCGRLLDQLLVASLRRAVTGRDPHDVAVLIADDLHLDMARPREVALDVHLVATEEALRLALRTRHRVGHLGGRLDDLHPAATTAEGGLDRDRPAAGLAERHDLFRTRRELGRAGNDRRATTLGGEPARDLVAHLGDRRRRRADERHAHVGDRAGEVGVLGEEAVAGVDAVGATVADRAEDRVGVEVTLGRGLPAERVRLVGEPDVQCVPIELGVDRDGLDTELASGADDAHGDLATVGDQDLLQHA